MTFKSSGFFPAVLARVRPLHLLFAAACLHVLTVIIICAAGHLSILPAPFTVDGLFAFDSLKNQLEAKTLVGVLSNEGLNAWLQYPFKSHIHLYSISLAIFGPIFGYSILAAEPLNLLCYLASLMLVYQIGKEAFGRVTGLTAAIVIGVWPSFVLHTTQFLKDPLFIVCMLTVVFVCITWLTKKTSWKGAFLLLLLGAVSLALIARMKSNMWESVLILTVAAFIMLLLRQALSRRIFAQNMFSAVLIVMFAVFMPLKATDGYSREQQADESPRQVEQTSFVWSKLGARIAKRREVFNLFGGSPESTIDGAVFFNNTGEIARYLPRATLVGFFAPFPQMWIAHAPTTGRTARLLSGAETMAFYLIVLAAGLCVYVERRKFATWFLLLVALINMVALGLIVTNVGALFRLRYVFWMLIIILGARGVVILASKLRQEEQTSI